MAIKTKNFTSVRNLLLALVLSQPLCGTAEGVDAALIAANITARLCPCVCPSSVSYEQTAFAAGLGAGVALVLTPVVQNHVFPRVRHFVTELPHYWAGESSSDMNIEDLSRSPRMGVLAFLRSPLVGVRGLFNPSRPDAASRRFLKNLDQTLIEAGCVKYPIVAGEYAIEDERLMGCQYVWAMKQQPRASISVVRQPPRREIGIPLPEALRPAYYPLHKSLRARAVEVLDIERGVLLKIPARGHHYAFTETEGDGVDVRWESTGRVGQQRQQQRRTASHQAGEARGAFLRTFSEAFPSLPAARMVRVAFNRSVAPHNELKLDTESSLAFLRQADGEVVFDLYFSILAQPPAAG